MPDAWGDAWGASWGNAWAAGDTPEPPAAEISGGWYRGPGEDMVLRGIREQNNMIVAATVAAVTSGVMQ